PADGALARDAGAGREHRVHRPERREPDHVVQRRRQAGPAEVVLVPVRGCDQEEQDQREPEREHEEAPVPEGAQELVADVRRGEHAAAPSWSPPVTPRNAASSPAPPISMSRATGYARSSARIAASESLHVTTTASPWRSARDAPGNRSSAATSTSGSVARI